MKYQSPPGVFDIIPGEEREPWRNSLLWQYVEDVMRTLAKQYGYQEIRTPVIERTELFQRSVGETSDIVSKEMYTFEDRGGRSLSLRPEGTAAVMRAFINAQMHVNAPIHKLFYIAPMFRYDRPQAGRYRQHHQFGAEAIGCCVPEQDAELIDLLHSVYRKLGLTNLKVLINSIGDDQSRENYRDALRDYLRPHFEKLSADSQRRFDANPLRIIDSKDSTDQELCRGAPSILDFLSPSSAEFFAEVRACLDRLQIPYEVSNSLVRGLDYYNQTVFEIVSSDLGAQSSIGGGGRFDGLIKQLGGPDLPSAGFGTGIERIIQTMLKQGVALPDQPRPKLFIVPLGDAARRACFGIMGDLRRFGLDVEMDFTGKKLAKVMSYADQIKAKYVAVIGENELASGSTELKEMASGNKQHVAFSDLAEFLAIVR
ncbi:MAG: histidine--tRNA ligase [Chlamydiales bacterium]|nr:histidine--tRNA ligase [Chlamydiales bacterium]